MPQTETNQHYVSQFLLRGFHTGREAQIWALDKRTSRSFTTAIKDVASEHGFYNIDGSPALDDTIRKFEDATAPIVEALRNRKSLRGLNGHDRIWLSGFTALQHVRTKAFSERDAADHAGRYTGEQRQTVCEPAKAIGTRRAGF
jgi:hypothetical protein